MAGISAGAAEGMTAASQAMSSPHPTSSCTDLRISLFIQVKKLPVA